MSEISQKLLEDAALAIAALHEYIRALPDDVVASLPAMPGIDGDWLTEVQEELRLAITEGNHNAAPKKIPLRTLFQVLTS
jgi:hypothetical protein